MSKPGYQQIAGQLRDRIGSAEAEWEAGAALPSEAQLAAEWGVGRTTIRRALGVLEAENLIEVVPGRGRFVRSANSDVTRQPGARFEQVAAVLRHEISKMSTGDRLDRETRLGERFQVAQGTIRQALLLLADQGLVHAAHGRGWFVGKGDSSATRTDEVANRLRSAITSGAIPVGNRLPGEIGLAAEYEAARVTVRRALAKLEAEGLIEKQSGRGRVVAAHQPQDSGQERK